MTHDLAKMVADLDATRKLLAEYSGVVQAYRGLGESSAVQAAMDALNSPAVTVVKELMDSPIMNLAKETASAATLLQESMRGSHFVEIAGGTISSLGIPSSSSLFTADLERASGWQNTVEGFGSATRAIAEQLKISNPLEMMITPHNWFTEVNTAAEQIRGQFTDAFGQMPIFDPFKGWFNEIVRGQRERQRMEKAGWLPHYTTPFDVLDNIEDEEIDNFLASHYTEQWPEVKAAFIKRLDDYSIDEEAKATFKEALNAHEHGFYRTVPRTLFPEIERIARQEFHAGSMEQVVTSQHKLIEIAGNLFPHETESYGFFDLILYSALTNHLYEYCNAIQLPEISKNPVPNRHAAIHGHVSYSTMKNSINTLIIIDFIFQVIHAAKKNGGQSAAA